MLHFTFLLLYFFSNLVPSEGCAAWINELHYDNVGSDTDEGIEIAGIAGTDLTDWTILFYNGLNGQVYRTITLTGTDVLTDDGSGLGFVAKSVSSIQNDDEGIALVDASGQVCEFLSYEGEFQATNGAAAGMTSTKIQDVLGDDVQERDTTPVGYSLQRSSQTTNGACSSVDDFVWVKEAIPSTFGARNTRQCETSCEAWINEFHYQNTGADAMEQIEIAGLDGTDLTDWRVILYNGNDNELYDTLSLSGTLTDEVNGVGFEEFDQTPIQNGNPDGLALVDQNDFVCEFLSYGGVITAGDGPAINLESVDIGVTETEDTLSTQSLQLTNKCGSGTNTGTWVGPLENTFGAVNDDQCTDAPTFAPTSSPTLSCLTKRQNCLDWCDDEWGFSTGSTTSTTISSSSSSSEETTSRRRLWSWSWPWWRRTPRQRRLAKWRTCRSRCRRRFNRWSIWCGYSWRWWLRHGDHNHNNETMTGSKNIDDILYMIIAVLVLIILVLLGCVYKKYVYNVRRSKKIENEMANEIEKKENQKEEVEIVENKQVEEEVEVTQED